MNERLVLTKMTQDSSASNLSAGKKSQSAPKRTISSEDIFGRDREVIIMHSGSAYRLQITKAGKLILNK